MCSARSLLIAAMGLLAAGGAWADDEAEQRARIAAQRSAVTSRYSAAVRVCEGKFAQTACLDQAKRERRRELDRLSAEQATLDQAVRQRRATERRREIEEKQREAMMRPAASAPAPQVRTPRPPAQPASPPPRRVRTSDDRASEAAAQAAQRQSAAAQRREQAQAHADTVRRRNAERAAKRTPAAPLPASAAASRALR